jgi:hypothetical protein
MSTPVPSPGEETISRKTMASAQNEVVPVIELKPVLAAQEKHGPIFRRELFDVAYAAYLSIDDKDPNEQVYMKDGRQSKILRTAKTLPDIYGIERKCPILRECMVTERENKPYVTKRVWVYNDLQALGLRYSEAEYDRLLPFQFGTTLLPIEEGEVDHMGAEFQDKIAQWRVEWEASNLSHRLTTFFKAHSQHVTKRVDQIMCFGLGSPVSEPDPISLRRSYVQHLAACTLRDHFGARQRGAIPQIFAQDPVYRTADTAYLAEHWSISVLADPEGFKALDGNTFVISIAPNVPVRQIVLDMTSESDGPAGFFCDEIHSDGLGGDGTRIEDIHSGVKTPYRTCNSSPGLWKYKQDSLWTEHDDQAEMGCFGKMGMYLKKGEEDITV